MLRVLFSWEFIGPHHRARISAAARRCSSLRARAFALSTKSATYDFYQHEDDSIELVVAYRSLEVEKLTFWQRLVGYVRHVWLTQDDVYFLCHYERPEVFLTAIFLRSRGKRVFVMNDSKFDDYQRYVWRELGKSVLYMPYCGALVSAARSASYLRFLGVRRIETGYDTLDVEAVQQDSRREPEVVLPDRYFIVVARLLKRKNVELVLRAFRAVKNEISGSLSILIVGDGPNEEDLRILAQQLCIDDKVNFLGKLPNEKISPVIARAAALILVSTSEQWGLVINEAVACNVPVIVSDAVGARDALVRNFVNGFVIESDNELGLARAMVEIARNAGRFRETKAALEASSVDRFADAVLALVEEPMKSASA